MIRILSRQRSRLTGKSNYKKSDIVDLSRLAALNDKDLSVFVAKKEGKTFLNSIQDDNMRTQITNAAHIKNEEKLKIIKMIRCLQVFLWIKVFLI